MSLLDMNVYQLTVMSTVIIEINIHSVQRLLKDPVMKTNESQKHSPIIK